MRFIQPPSFALSILRCCSHPFKFSILTLFMDPQVMLVPPPLDKYGKIRDWMVVQVILSDVLDVDGNPVLQATIYSTSYCLHDLPWNLSSELTSQAIYQARNCVASLMNLKSSSQFGTFRDADFALKTNFAEPQGLLTARVLDLLNVSNIFQTQNPKPFVKPKY